MFSTLRGVPYIGGYHKYIGGGGDIMSTLGGGGVLSMSGAYHEYIGDDQYIGGCLGLKILTQE